MVTSAFLFAEYVDLDRYFKQSHGTVVSIVSSVVASGTVVFVVVLAPGLTVVPGPAGCCFEFLDLVVTTADGIVGFGFLVVLESMLLGGLV